MSNSSSLARWCGIAGVVAMLIGVVVGVLGLIYPNEIYAPQAMPPYNFATSIGKVAALMNGIMMLLITAAFTGFYFVGAVGRGMLGKVATIITALANIGPAIGFLMAVFTGEMGSPFFLGYLTLIGFPLLTVAALRAKTVSKLHALWPVLVLLALLIAELAAPISGITVIIHDVIYGSIGLIVLSNLKKVASPEAAVQRTAAAR